MRISSLGLIAVAALGLGGCAYDGYGSGIGVGIDYGNGYGGYGYGSPYYGYGYGSPYYGYGYNSPYYGGYYGSPYGGWYDGYYYPGSGYYVYDRNHHRRQISEAERAAWRQRIASGVATRIRENRGETITTNSVTREQILNQRAIRSQNRVTTSDSGARERFRESLRSRIETRRAERAQRKDD